MTKDKETRGASSFPEQQRLQEGWADFLKRRGFKGKRPHGATRPGFGPSGDEEAEAAADDGEAEAEASPTPVDAEEVPAAPAQGARNIKISASSRYGDATTLEDIAIQMLGLPGRPDPNKDRQQNRAVQQLTAKIMHAVKKALQNEFGASLGAVQTTYENNQAEIEKLFMEEFHKSRK